MCEISKSYPLSECMVGHLVTEVIKTVLYIRGQFPMPLEHMRDYIRKLKKDDDDVKSDCNIAVYNDPKNSIQNEINNQTQITNRRGRFHDLMRQKLFDAITKFEQYFVELELLIQGGNVLEIVLGLGNSFMVPKELYHIKLPEKCGNEFCKWSRHSYNKCKATILKDLFQNNQVIGHLPSETVMPIYVMLLLEDRTKLSGNVEYKNCYKIPKTSKQVTLSLKNFCSHNSTNASSSNSHQDDESSQSINPSNAANSDQAKIWVKLKTDIKGLSNKVLDC